jgi:hypothetical protein
MKSLLLAAVMAFGVVLGVTTDAKAVSYTFNNTNGGDGFLNIVPGGFQIVGADNGVGSTFAYLTGVADTNGPFTFNWTYITFDSDGPSFDRGGYFVGNVATQLSQDELPFGSSQSGTVTLNLSIGNSFGWYINSSDAAFGRASITITEVTAGVPEPVHLGNDHPWLRGRWLHGLSQNSQE